MLRQYEYVLSFFLPVYNWHDVTWDERTSDPCCWFSLELEGSFRPGTSLEKGFGIWAWASEMDRHQACGPEFYPRSHTVGENRNLQVVLWPLCVPRPQNTQINVISQKGGTSVSVSILCLPLSLTSGCSGRQLERRGESAACNYSFSKLVCKSALAFILS